MNIVIPMAGRGERFKKDGYLTPKPLISFSGKTMIEYALESLNLKGNYIFIVYKYSDLNLNNLLNSILKKYSDKIITIDYITDGPASSALLSKDYINNDDPLLITNCDQIMNWNSHDFLNFTRSSDFDGVVVTYNSDTEKNSYVKVDNQKLAIQFAEKQVISKYSLNGIHYWKKGKYFVESTEKMIQQNIRCNNEFYISLTYNEMIKENKKIGIYPLAENSHFSVGTPEDLKKFLKLNEYSKI